MRILTSLALAFTAAVVAAPAAAEGVKLYPYAAKENYCPAGLQPVSIAGVICCGKPNQSMTYQQVMAHPVRKRVKKVHHVRADVCPEGQKGCY